MRYDDAFKHVQEVTRQFREISEITRGPFDQINEILRMQETLYRPPEDLVAEAFRGATAYRALATEVDQWAKSLREGLATAANTTIGQRWALQEAFYRGGRLEHHLDTRPIYALFDAIKNPADALEDTFAEIQKALRIKVASANDILGSISALKLEEQLGNLAAKATTHIAAQMEDFRRNLNGLNGPTPSESLLEQLSGLASSLDLPYLRNAALQWSLSLQELSATSLGAEQLLQSTIKAISRAANSTSADDVNSILREWERLAVEEGARYEEQGTPMPSWLEGFLLNLFFFLLSQICLPSADENAAKQLERIVREQTAIVESVEHDREDEAKERLELAAIRQALNELAEAVDDGEEDANLRVADANLRLRAAPARDGKVLLTIPRGFPAEIVEEQGKWCKIKVMNFANGEFVEGWAAAEHLQEWHELDEEQ